MKKIILSCVILAFTGQLEAQQRLKAIQDSVQNLLNYKALPQFDLKNNIAGKTRLPEFLAFNDNKLVLKTDQLQKASLDNMPVIELPGNSKMPVVKIEGYSK